jgi:hypothetical protein
MSVSDASSDASSDVSPPEIVLVRHGPSAHVERGWIDADGVRRWMVAYDAAEIAMHSPPPPALTEIARGAGLLVASDLPRAVASAALLTSGREVRTSALLREAPLETPELPLPGLAGIRLPLRGWAVVFAARWLRASWRGSPPPGVDAVALARADEAADWLTALADEHGRVVAVTHATFRLLVTASLTRRGWNRPERRPVRTWSAWHLRRADR